VAIDRFPDLYQLADGCRRCGRRERRRIFAWTIELYRGLDPSTPVETIRCRCGLDRVVNASAYQDATLDEASTRH